MTGGASKAIPPVVSAIVSAARRRECTANALRSVQAQTYPHYEVVVLDDGASGEPAEAISAADGASLTSRSDQSDQTQALRWQSSRHPQHGQSTNRGERSAGLGAARNRAIRRCRGELIALLDGDAEWTPDKLEKCVARLQANSHEDLVYSQVASTASAAPPTSRSEAADQAGWMFDRFFEGVTPLDSAVVFRRRVWERIGGFDETLPTCVGYNFWLRAALGHRFGVIHEPLVVCSAAAANEPVETLRELSVRARVLYECYELKGGVDRVDRRRAGRIIAGAFRRAGWLALRIGNGTVAEAAFAIAAGYSPSFVASLLLWLGSAQRRWNRQPSYSIESDALTFLR